jgi:DNA ligase-1
MATPYASLALIVGCWQRVLADSRRSVKVSALAECLRALAPAEIELGALYLAGELPQGKLGIGPALLERAAAVAPANHGSLTLADVDTALSELEAMRGARSAARREQALAELFGAASADEQAFLQRLLRGELRAGALGGVMLDAIASAAQLPSATVRRAAMFAPQLGAVARLALTQGSVGLATFQLETLHPLAPMLAQTAADVGDALARLGGAAIFEWKVDGARIQLHKRGDEVRIFTRALHDVAASLPELVELARSLPAGELVLDGEAVALDAAGRPRPFQITMRRFGRRLDVEALRSELPLHAYFFDCLRLEQQSLIERPMSERFEALSRVVAATHRIERLSTAAEDIARRFYQQALDAGHEGVMAKAPAAPYEAGSRGASWLKIKRAHTLDLVVLAAEWGHGRRHGWLSNLHLGAREGSGYVMLGKTFKGLTDAMLQWQTGELLAREARREAITVYVRPELVVEIAFNDIQASPQYPGGLALRFARVKRYRDDKDASEADDLETVRLLYQRQSGAV